MRHFSARGAVLCVLSACGTALGVGAAEMAPPAAEELVQRYPGVQVHVQDGRVISLYGHAMNAAATPDQAAGDWVARESGAFGVPGLDLRPLSLDPVMEGKFTVYAYQQFIQGVPVEYGLARVLVLNGTRSNSVVYAAGKLAMPPATGFAPLKVGQEQALLSVRGKPEYQKLENWGVPALVAFYGEGDLAQWTTAVRCWKFTGWNSDMANHTALTFFVDASTGGVVKVRDEVYGVDVSGTVTGMGTPGLSPDAVAAPPTGVPPVVLPVNEVQVNITGGGNALTNAAGAYTITNAGSTPVTVTTAINQGPWCRIVPTGAAVLSLSQSVTPPGPANFLYNPAPSENTTSQVNGFLIVTKTHDFFKSHAPSFTGLDLALTTNVNLAQTCNAFFTNSPLSLNFFHSGGGCVNSAYSTVGSHEYGHFILNQRGVAQGAFGEGYGDTNAVMIWDTPVIAQDFFGTGSPIRNVLTANQQYPCSGEIHTCGQVLAGTWWGIRQNFGAAFGSGPGLDMVRNLEVAWTLVTVGGNGTNSAWPQTAIEVLTLDDDNGNLADGTPNYSRICPAFAAHGIQCPAVQLIAFQYPNGIPATLTPGQPTAIRFDVVGIGSSTPAPGTGQAFYRVNGGAFQAAAVTQGVANQYTATIPGQVCLASVDFYFQAAAQSGGTATDPSTAPASAYNATVAASSTVALADNFSTNMGWTVGSPTDTATTGIWVRADPIGTAAQPSHGRSGAAGDLCFFTGQGTVGGGVGEQDVDGGPTTLTSPTFSMAGAGDGVISYWRWFSNDQGANPSTMSFVIDLSNDNGATWHRAETVGPTGAGTMGGWIFHQFRAAAVAAPTATMKMRFVATDTIGAVVEAAIDDFRAATLSCTAACPPDINGDGSVNIADFLAFLQLYSSGAAAADFNGDGQVNVTDFLAFLAAYAAGC
jgi:hypothetical protein